MNKSHRARRGEHMVQEFGRKWKVRDGAVRGTTAGSNRGFRVWFKRCKVSEKLLSRERHRISVGRDDVRSGQG